MKQKSMTLVQKKSIHGLLFISPWIIGFLLFFLYPIIHSLTLSVNKIKMQPTGYEKEYLGIKNYVDALTVDPQFIRHLYSAITNMLIDVPIVLVFSFFVAVLLKKKFIGSSLAKAVFFLPVILGSGVFLMYQSQLAGVQNVTIEAAKQEGTQAIQILQSINIEKYILEMGISPEMMNYITGPIDKIYSVISASGVQIFIFLAGLHSIPPQIFEACYIEGATGWETFWKITFPMISPLILVNTIYSIVDSFTSFKNVPMNYLYQMAFDKFEFGLSAAMSWIYFAVLAAILGMTGYMISKKVFYHT